MASIPVQGTLSSFFKAWGADGEMSKQVGRGTCHGLAAQSWGRRTLPDLQLPQL